MILKNLFVLCFGRKFSNNETHLHSKRLEIVFLHNIQAEVRKKSNQKKKNVYKIDWCPFHHLHPSRLLQSRSKIDEGAFFARNCQTSMWTMVTELFFYWLSSCWSEGWFCFLWVSHAYTAKWPLKPSDYFSVKWQQAAGMMANESPLLSLSAMIKRINNYEVYLRLISKKLEVESWYTGVQNSTWNSFRIIHIYRLMRT